MTRSTSPTSLSWSQRPLRELTRLAWPIAVSSISYSVMTLVDTLFVGHLGADALAGTGLGGTIAFTILCFGFGTVRGVKTLIAQALGAGRRDTYGPALGAASITALVLGVAAVGVGLAVAQLLPLIAGGAAGVAAQTYLGIRILGAPLAMLQAALRETRYGIGDSHSPMRATVTANLGNIALNWLLVVVLGLGVAGSAWATVAAHAIEAGLLIVVQLREGADVRGTRWRHIVELLRIGVPTGLQFILEVGSFALLAAIIAGLGSTQMAAHQIALQVIHFSFLPAFAVSEAACVLAGNAVGAGRYNLVRVVARKAMLVSALYMGLGSLVLVTLAPRIASGFTPDVEVRSVATSLLYVAVVFQVFDAANMVARGVLRGTGDVRVPAVICVLTSWALTPPLTWFLGSYLGLGAFGGWVGLCAEIVFGALVLWWRLERRGWLPAAEASRRALAIDSVGDAKSEESDSAPLHTSLA